MINKIRNYIDHAFEAIPQTKKVLELKEELFSNLIEKYNDQLRVGKTEMEAYNVAIAGIGDISELVDSIKTYDPLVPMTSQEITRRAAITAVAVMLYILSPMLLILSSNFGAEITGLCLMFLFIAIATGLLVFNGATKEKYRKTDDTLVEDFKEWRGNSAKERSAYSLFSSAFWSVVTATYLLVSFVFGIWIYSWIIFIVAGAIESMIKGILQLRSMKDE